MRLNPVKFTPEETTRIWSMAMSELARASGEPNIGETLAAVARAAIGYDGLRKLLQMGQPVAIGDGAVATFTFVPSSDGDALELSVAVPDFMRET